MVVFVLNIWLTPPERKPRKIFFIISGATISKLSIRAKDTGSHENLM